MWIFGVCLAFVTAYFAYMFVDIVKGIFQTSKLYR